MPQIYDMGLPALLPLRRKACWAMQMLHCHDNKQENFNAGIVQLKCDGTQWHTGGEVKGKLANGVGSWYPSHYLGTWCIQHYYQQWKLMCTPRLPVVGWTDTPADLNGLVCFTERRNLVSVRVPSHFKCSLHMYAILRTNLSCFF
jgi:hypothetical protein